MLQFAFQPKVWPATTVLCKGYPITIIPTFLWNFSAADSWIELHLKLWHLDDEWVDVFKVCFHWVAVKFSQLQDKRCYKETQRYAWIGAGCQLLWFYLTFDSLVINLFSFCLLQTCTAHTNAIIWKQILVFSIVHATAVMPSYCHSYC